MFKGSWQRRAERAEAVLRRLRFRIKQGDRYNKRGECIGRFWWTICTPDGNAILTCTPDETGRTHQEAVLIVRRFFGPDIKELF